MVIETKRLQATDIDLAKKLIKVWQEVDGIENGKIPSEAYLIESLSEKHFHVMVALENDEVLGGLTAYELRSFDVEQTELFLFELGVSPHHRKRGVARKLLEDLSTACIQKGIKTFFLGTEMDNTVARQVYEKTGGKFEQIAWYTYELI